MKLHWILILFLSLSSGFWGLWASAEFFDPSVMTYNEVGKDLSPTKKSEPESVLEKNYIRKPKWRAPKRKIASEAAKNDDDSEADDSNEKSAANAGAAAPAAGPLGASGPKESKLGSSAEAGNFGTQLRDLVLGGDLEGVHHFRGFLDVQDLRRNILEFSAAASYMYNASTSPYYFRNYFSASPDVVLGMNIWITPFFGVNGNYRFSMLSSLSDSPTSNTFAASTNTWYDLGFKFRRFLGLSSTASSLVLSLNYFDYKLSISPTAISRLSEDTSGPLVGFDISVPNSKTFVWNLGFVVKPFLNHSEKIYGSDLRAGQSNQTVGMGAHIGNEYRLSRSYQYFMNLSVEVYQSQFSGSTLSVDPVSGTNPSNVSVNNTFLLIDMGLRFGQ
jgi:hypothetical protein